MMYILKKPHINPITIVYMIKIFLIFLNNWSEIMLSSSAEGNQTNLSLKGNFIWTFMGNLIYAMCQWGIFISITKFGTPEMVGQYALGLAITAPIVLFLNLNLRVVMVTDKKEMYSFNDYFTLRIVMVLLSLCIIFFVSLFLTSSLITLLVVLQVGLSKAFECISDIFHGIFQKVERMNLVSISKILKGALSLILVLILLYFTEDIIMALSGLVISWVIILIIYDYKNGKRILKNYLDKESEIIKFNWSFYKIKRLSTLSLPLGIVAALDSLNVNVPRYFIQGSEGEVMLGYFAAITYLMVVGSTIINALGQAVTPRLSLYYSKKDFGMFKNLFYKFVLVSLGIGLLGIFVATTVGESVLTIIYSEDYAQFNNSLILVMIAAQIWYISSALGTALNATRNFKIQIPIYGLMVTFSTISSIYLIPSYHLNGAAIALCIGMMVRMGASFIVLQKVFKGWQGA